MSSLALVAQKKALRSKITEVLAGLMSESVSAQSRTCLQSLLALPEYQSSKRISVYLSMPSKEIDTRSIVEDAFAKGKTVFIPYTYRSSEQGVSPKMDMLSLHSLEDYRSLKPNSWGIPTPSKASLPDRKDCLGEGDFGLDMVIVPGVAFDESCRRLGHGKGYYDYFFQRYKDASKANMPTLVALALKEQIISETESVPVDDTDYRVDKILVGNGTVLQKMEANQA